MDLFVAFDLETTGLYANGSDRIIEIAAILFDRQGNVVGKPFDLLVNPGIHIPEATDPDPHRRGQQLGHNAAAAITGIHDDMVQGCVDPAEAVRQFKAFIGNAQLVGHGCEFDRRFLAVQDPSFATRAQHDTLNISHAVIPGLPSYKLVDLVHHEHLDKSHQQPHRAWSDAMATKELFLALAKEAERLPKDVLATVRAKYRHIAKPYAAQVSVFLEKVVSGDGVETPVTATPAATAGRSLIARVPTASRQKSILWSIPAAPPIAPALPTPDVLGLAVA